MIVQDKLITLSFLFVELLIQILGNFGGLVAYFHIFEGQLAIGQLLVSCLQVANKEEHR